MGLEVCQCCLLSWFSDERMDGTGVHLTLPFVFLYALNNFNSWGGDQAYDRRPQRKDYLPFFLNRSPLQAVAKLALFVWLPGEGRKSKVLPSGTQVQPWHPPVQVPSVPE